MNTLNKEVLMTMEKEQLVDLLLTAIQLQQQTTENMSTMIDTMAKADARIKELDDQKASMEAELLVLRNRT